MIPPLCPPLPVVNSGGSCGHHLSFLRLAPRMLAPQCPRKCDKHAGAGAPRVLHFTSKLLQFDMKNTPGGCKRWVSVPSVFVPFLVTLPNRPHVLSHDFVLRSSMSNLLVVVAAVRSHGHFLPTMLEGAFFSSIGKCTCHWQCAFVPFCSCPSPSGLRPSYSLCRWYQFSHLDVPAFSSL
jgi:hypothetical protein